MSDLAPQTGKLLPKEKQLISNSLRLNDATANDLMTPRNVVEFLPHHLTIADVLARNGQVIHSRLPPFTERNSKG